MNKRKAPSSEDTPNHDLCEFLVELANYEKNVTRDIHKYSAYRKAAAILAEQSMRIKSGGEARKLKGIGDKISKKIDEYLATGKLRKLENIHNDSKNMTINLLTSVSGIGPAKAHALFDEGITTLEDLRKHSDKLTHHQFIGLKYFEDFAKKIPREEIVQFEKIIIKEIHKLNPEYKITICGSYRRGALQSGDVDILITHPNVTSDKIKKKQKSNDLKIIVDTLERCGLLTEALSQGSTKYMGACQLDEHHPTRRIDIRLTAYNQYYCSILYFTGSDMFNKNMRAHALEQGFTLNEYSLRPLGITGVPGEPVEINSEEDIFEYINFPYRKPDERNC